MEVRVRRYRLRKQGHRGASITVPAEYIEDMGLAPNDSLDAYRDDRGRLIYVPTSNGNSHTQLDTDALSDHSLIEKVRP